MLNFLSIDNIAFTLWGYPLSYIELIGTLLYLWSVWLIANKRLLTWPVGIVSVLLYMALFYQIRLYSDALEQIYYLGASLYGWWHWNKSRQVTNSSPNFRYSIRRNQILTLAIAWAISFVVGAWMSRIHLLFPALFPEAASFPYLDAFTTIMSFTAMGLMARQRIESWYYWIVIDILGIGLYYVKEVRFISLLYVILLAMAINGLIAWHKAAKTPKIAY